MKVTTEPVRRRGWERLWFSVLFAALVPISAFGSVSAQLLPRVDQVRLALAEWRLSSLVEAADAIQRFELPDPAQPEDPFWQSYWAGVAGFNAVLCAREDSGSEVAGVDVADLMDRAGDSLNEALKIRSDHAECHAMLAVLDGVRISDKPWTALFRGPSLMRHRAVASDAEPRSPRTAYLLGTSQLKRAKDDPGIREAIVALEQAVDLFGHERDRSLQPWEPDWGYDHTLLFLGEAHQALNEWTEAATWYERALGINPHLERARHGLEQCRSQTESR